MFDKCPRCDSEWFPVYVESKLVAYSCRNCPALYNDNSKQFTAYFNLDSDTPMDVIWDYADNISYIRFADQVIKLDFLDIKIDFFKIKNLLAFL